MDFADYELGPKMKLCSEKERLFVWEFVRSGGGARQASGAAREAGYVDSGTGAIRVTAHRVLHRDRVLAAIEEVGRQAFRSQLAPAVSANLRLIEDRDHPDHWKAVHATLSRNGLIERTGVDVNVTGEISVNHTEAALGDLRALLALGVPREKLVETFGFSGLARYERMLAETEGKQPKVITKVIEHRSDE
jgi:hypothetical protein